jgi:type IV pilus assembly protein PilY1
VPPTAPSSPSPTTTALVIDSLPVLAACLSGQANGAVLLRPRAPAGGDIPGSAGDLYQATMSTGDWGGHFSRYLLPAGGTASATTLAWDAGAILTGTPARPPMPTPSQRQIYTAIVQPNGALQMVPFTWPSLSPAQQALLNLEDNAGEQRLTYLRGDRALEGTTYRRRSSILGDAVHSTPVYAGPVDQRAAVYLGANDGMLHAFDANTGIELFAYIPDALIAHLHHLTDPAYQHRAYVDGPASIGGSKKNILISAMGGGAKGVFALDITDPTHFADGPGALWEFTDRDDPLMGNVTTIPQTARVRVRSNVYRHFAIVANGLNAEDGALFLLALDKPRSEGWQLNSNYYRIRTRPGALSAPVLLNDSDGVLRHAYAGDLQGNLWRFDFDGSAPWLASKLFAARDANGRPQPITEQPLLAYAKAGGYMILFGTGQLIEATDRNSTAQQSYYAIVDNLQDSISGRSQLTQRFLDGSDMAMEPGSKGWYIDFTQAGERSVHAGVLADGAVLFNTVLPGADMCSQTRSRSYVLNVLTGLPDDGEFVARLPTDEAIVGAMLPDYAPSPSLLPLSVNHSARDALGRVRQEKSYAVVQPGGQGQVVATGSIKTARRSGRLSWREVPNWRELHEAAK